MDHEQLSPELEAEYTVRAKAYSRRKMAQHRAWQRDLSRKIQLKEAALAQLPPQLREAAEQVGARSPLATSCALFTLEVRLIARYTGACVLKGKGATEQGC